MTEFVISIFGREAHMQKIAGVKERLRPALSEAMKAEMFRVADYVRTQKLSGQVLNRRSGDLSRSITGQLESETAGTITGKVGTKGIPYAGVHEFGAVFTRSVRMVFGRPIIPVQATFHYPERSFLRSSANENADKVSAKLQATAAGVFSAA